MPDAGSNEFYRIGRLPPYVFAEVNAMKERARAKGADIIDFGMGNPDMPTPSHIVEKLVETVRNPKTHRYSASRGIPGLRRANAGYYKRRFGVDIDPETETIATLGSKEGLANLAMAITEPGDVVIAPNPSYPIHPYGFIIAEGDVQHVPCGPGHDFMAGLRNAVDNSPKKPKALVVNFPSNPTAEVVDLSFYEELVDFATEHDIWVLSDLAYAEVYFDGNPPPSILQVPRAKEIAIEFTSVSKTYSMPGWRIGFATGNQTLVRALTRIKSYLDYGAFTPIQVAAATALNGPQECVEEMRDVYRGRRDVLCDGLARCGWEFERPAATMFVWAPVPDAYKEMGSMEFSKLLLKEASVAVSPGIGFGAYGEGYLRIALVENEHRIRQAVRNIRQMFKSHAESGRKAAAQ